MKRALFSMAVAGLLLAGAGPRSQAADPLPSWNDGAAKRAIVEFVAKVTKDGSPGFVKPADRIATFDNDGTLWAEQPLPFQLFFTIDRVKALAPQHPEWKDKEPFASLLKGDVKGAFAAGERGALEVMTATHAGMTTAEFEKTVDDWIATAKHPVTRRLFTGMAYQPMLELLAYLRANGFRTYIVSAGGVEFMRPWAEATYGIPPEQVIGSSIKTKYELRDGKPVLVRLPERDGGLVFDEAKVIAIHQRIGRRPIAAFGNSDGDIQMLEWATAGPAPGLAMYIHHTDAEREYAYDREYRLSPLVKGLELAQAKGWTVVDMKKDWKVVYP